MFDSPTKLALGFLTGFLFGFFLQKGRVAKFEVIVGQFLFKDWTVVKVMGTAVAVGAVGVYALVAADLATLHIKPALLGGVFVGAVCFGIGMAVLGYCPGTSVAGCGEGRRDAMVGVAGMLAGAALFVAMFPALQPLINGLGNLGEVTLPELTHTSPWLWVAGLAIAAAGAWLGNRWNRGDPGRGQDSLPRRAHPIT
ncbi:MAG: YeeE/YedE family protein [Pirellulales bacterium]|nr:YeeE/YedE family protein [Pirellulales bacterium]